MSLVERTQFVASVLLVLGCRPEEPAEAGDEGSQHEVLGKNFELQVFGSRRTENLQLKTERRGAILNESAQGSTRQTQILAGDSKAGWGRAITMRATRTTRSSGRRARPVKRVTKRVAAKPAAKPVAKVVAPPAPVLYKLCKPGWAVIVERIPNALGTRFVCPFCPKSHRVPGPVRGFKKMRHAQWGRLRRVEE